MSQVDREQIIRAAQMHNTLLIQDAFNLPFEVRRQFQSRALVRTYGTRFVDQSNVDHRCDHPDILNKDGKGSVSFVENVRTR